MDHKSKPIRTARTDLMTSSEVIWEMIKNLLISQNN